MEQIARRDGVVYYGSLACESVNDAYLRFRAEYHGELGRRIYRRLDRRARVERVHGYKSFYTESRSRYLADKYSGHSRVRIWAMGLVGTSYCHAIGTWYLPDLTEEEYWEFIDWLLDVNSSAVYVMNRKNKSGRTAKKNRRYR